MGAIPFGVLSGEESTGISPCGDWHCSREKPRLEPLNNCVTPFAGPIPLIAKADVVRKRAEAFEGGRVIRFPCPPRPNASPGVEPVEFSFRDSTLMRIRQGRLSGVEQFVRVMNHEVDHHEPVF